MWKWSVLLSFLVIRYVSHSFASFSIPQCHYTLTIHSHTHTTHTIAMVERAHTHHVHVRTRPHHDSAYCAQYWGDATWQNGACQGTPYRTNYYVSVLRAIRVVLLLVVTSCLRSECCRIVCRPSSSFLPSSSPLLSSPVFLLPFLLSLLPFSFSSLLPLLDSFLSVNRMLSVTLLSMK